MHYFLALEMFSLPAGFADVGAIVVTGVAKIK